MSESFSVLLYVFQETQKGCVGGPLWKNVICRWCRRLMVAHRRTAHTYIHNHLRLLPSLLLASLSIEYMVLLLLLLLLLLMMCLLLHHMLHMWWYTAVTFRRHAWLHLSIRRRTSHVTLRISSVNARRLHIRARRRRCGCPGSDERHWCAVRHPSRSRGNGNATKTLRRAKWLPRCLRCHAHRRLRCSHRHWRHLLRMWLLLTTHGLKEP